MMIKSKKSFIQTNVIEITRWEHDKLKNVLFVYYYELMLTLKD